jgi:putative acetyltransferase
MGAQSISKTPILVEVTPDSPSETIATARELLLEYGRFVAAQPGVAGFCFGALAEEAARLPESYPGRGGGVLLAYIAATPMASVVWRTLPSAVLATAWEIKRLWVRPEARGLGLSRTLMHAILDRARAAGKTHLLLDTEPTSMAAAYRLYLDFGFRECAAYRGNPTPGIVYMRKDL